MATRDRMTGGHGAGWAMGPFRPGRGGLLAVIAVMAVTWGVSAVGYYEIIAALQLSAGYNDAPVLFTLYYGGWALVAFLLFRPALNDWSNHAPPGNDRYALAVLFCLFCGFALVVLPLLPEPDPPDDPALSDIIVAEPTYFLPKTVEILFQQILVAALVLVLRAQGLSMRLLSATTALLFGGIHVTLAFTGATELYVFRYTLAATLFGAVAPYLLLRVRHGMALAFGLHWGWYAFDATVSRFVFAAPQ